MMIGGSSPILNERRFRPDGNESQAGWAAPAQPGAPGGPATGVSYVEPSQRTMTVTGTLVATGVLWAILVAAGAFGWSQVTLTTVMAFDPATMTQVETTQVDFPGWIFAPMLIGVVLAFVIAFKPHLARFLSPFYALGYGVALGAISAMFEAEFSGIVLQAVGTTLAVFGVMLFLYGSRIIKVTRRFAMVVVGATFGIFLMYLVGFVASMFGADVRFWNEPSALGIGISVVIAGVAALNLALNFAFIEEAVNRGMPKYMEWYGAFGVTVTTVWLYLEILRLLAMLRQS